MLGKLSRIYSLINPRSYNLRSSAHEKGCQTIIEYSQASKNLCDQLVDLGCSVDDSDNVHWFLNGLGPTFSTTMLSHFPSPYFKDIFPKTKSHYIFIKSIERHYNIVIAFIAQRRGCHPHRDGCRGGNQCTRNQGYGGGRSNSNNKNFSNTQQPKPCSDLYQN